MRELKAQHDITKTQQGQYSATELIYLATAAAAGAAPSNGAAHAASNGAAAAPAEAKGTGTSFNAAGVWPAPANGKSNYASVSFRK